MRPFVLISSILALAPPSASHGATIVSNLGEATSSVLQLVPGGDVDGTSFTVDGSDYTLNSVTLNMNDGTAGSGFSVQIRDDDGAGSDPGTVLANLTGNTSPATAGTYTYTGSLTLLANQTYWVTATVPGGGSGDFRWFSTTSLAQTGSWTIGDQVKVSSDGGTTYGQTFNNRALMFSVDADVVPEPSGVALLSLAGIALLMRRRR